MYDSSTETYDGDTPISRIDSTMHTILYDIAFSLTETQSINIYFIPLVQLDHMVFVNDILLLRYTLLWTIIITTRQHLWFAKNGRLVVE